MTLKQKLKNQYVLPKRKLRAERLKRELTTAYMANLIGLERRQYEMKEKGYASFKDYEMAIIAKEFGVEETKLFF